MHLLLLQTPAGLETPESLEAKGSEVKRCDINTRQRPMGEHSYQGTRNSAKVGRNPGFRTDSGSH